MNLVEQILKDIRGGLDFVIIAEKYQTNYSPEEITNAYYSARDKVAEDKTAELRNLSNENYEIYTDIRFLYDYCKMKNIKFYDIVEFHDRALAYINSIKNGYVDCSCRLHKPLEKYLNGDGSLIVTKLGDLDFMESCHKYPDVRNLYGDDYDVVMERLKSSKEQLIADYYYNYSKTERVRKEIKDAATQTDWTTQRILDSICNGTAPYTLTYDEEMFIVELMKHLQAAYVEGEDVHLSNDRRYLERPLSYIEEKHTSEN